MILSETLMVQIESLGD